MIKKFSLLTAILLICLISITCVSADDNLTDAEISSANEQSDNILSISDNDILADEPGNFNELSKIIEEGNGTIELTKDYTRQSTDNVSNNGIIIDKTLTINGNGHVIDAAKLCRIFIITGNNVVLNNITFVNGNFYGWGGMIYSNGNNLNISNCNFYNSYGARGGALHTEGSSFSMENTTFENNSAGIYGGAMVNFGSFSTIRNSTFTNNTAYYYGGAVISDCFYLKIYDSNFNNNTVTVSASGLQYGGGAVYSDGYYTTLENCNFTGNKVPNSNTGAVMMEAVSSNINNCIFSNNSARNAGAACIPGRGGTINNSTFINNRATDSNAGAIDWYGTLGTLINSSFINNSASDKGGAIFWRGNNGTIENTSFISNKATSTGGGLYYRSYGAYGNNVTFINNSGSTGGGAYLFCSLTDDGAVSNSVFNNSKFIGNTARYGGGGADVSDYFLLYNSTFINNRAGNYGGGVSVSNAYISNISLINNSALHGGGVYTYNSLVNNSVFDNNNAVYGNSIYVVNQSTLNENTVLDKDIYYKSAAAGGEVVGRDHEIFNILQTDEGYYGFCSERYNMNPYSGEYDGSLELLRNVINHQPVGEYLKILFYNFVDNATDLGEYTFNQYVWTFTDWEYWNSTDPIIQEVIRLYDSGFRVSSQNACKVLSNGTLMYFNFSSLITPSGQQNLFLFKFNYGDEINETMSKESLNKTAFVNDNVEFRIIVSNKGTSPIYMSYIEDKDYSNGLKYENWIGELGNWTYDNKTGRWYLDILEPGKSASIILIFKVLVNGTLYNNATAGVGNKNMTNSTNSTTVYNPNMEVSKISLNESVVIGDKTSFKIFVKNTGDIDLNNVTVVEDSHTGLVYDSYTGSEWKHYIKNTKHTWTLKNKLAVGENASFIIVFKAVKSGNLTNTVSVNSNETGNKTANNTTKVLNINLEVSKLSLNKTVKTGQKIIFEIIVKNTGETDLKDVYIVENKYGTGLVYSDYESVNNNWKHSLNNEGKHMFTLTDLLKTGESARISLIFIATKKGNFTNQVTVGYNNKTYDNSTNSTEITDNKTANPTENSTNIDNKIKSSTNSTETLKPTENRTDKNATGNPLMILLFAIIIIPIRRFIN